jgi:hypothetical protein
MLETSRTSTRSRWIAVVLILSGCASGGTRETPAAVSRKAFADATLFGVAGDRFVAVDPDTGTATELATSRDLWEVGALTYDPASRTFYAVAHASSDPELIAIDRDRGETRKIGPIDLPTLDLTLVEGLAFDPVDGVLWATGSRSTFASERLLTIDVATGAAKMVGPIHGTAQNDVDALIAVGGKLYGADAAGNSSAVYQIDKHSAQASLQPRRFPRAVTDLAFDPDGRRLLATVEGANLLLAMAPSGQVEELGPTHSETALGGWPISALTCVTVPSDLFGDDFESGDLSLWDATPAAVEPPKEDQ